MSAAEAMKALLRPMRVYRLEDSFLETELESMGAALDGVQQTLEELQREMCLATAQDAGLEAVSELLARRPVAAEPDRLGPALAALLRIGGDSFTPADINDTVRGCGLDALVSEEPGVPGAVTVSFPGVRGIPDGMEELRGIIEDILPAHVSVRYRYWFQQWSQLNDRGLTWRMLRDRGVTWDALEKMTD